jgi:hypothetical protein
VFQPEVSGCGIAVLAIVAGKTYREARQYFSLERDFTKSGMHNHELEEALVALGFAMQPFTRSEARLGHSIRAKWPIDPVTDLSICQVRNLRDACWHYVVTLRDGRVLDPAFGVINGLYLYPEVLAMWALYPIPAAS